MRAAEGSALCHPAARNKHRCDATSCSLSTAGEAHLLSLHLLPNDVQHPPHNVANHQLCMSGAHESGWLCWCSNAVPG